MTSQHFSRRKFLRGVGVTMALPWMESLGVWGEETTKAAKPASQAPVRLAVLFSGNGFHAGQWWAKGESGDRPRCGQCRPCDPARARVGGSRAAMTAVAPALVLGHVSLHNQ